MDKDAAVISSGDLDGWIDLFADDVIFMPPNAAHLKGKAAVREFGGVYFDQFNMEFALTVDEIEVHGRNRIIMPSSKRENGKEIWILKRQSDGSWKCSHIIWNTHNPPPEGPT